MASCFHVVAAIQTQDRSIPSSADRLAKILSDGALSPPWRELRTNMRSGSPQLEQARTEDLAYYLSGLRHFVFFAYGRPYSLATAPTVASFEIDAETLVFQLGARVVREESIMPEDVLERLEDELWYCRDPDLDTIGFAIRDWRENPTKWEHSIWPRCLEVIESDLTLGGVEAMAFLESLDPKDWGLFDLLVRGPVPLRLVQQAARGR